MKIRSLGIMALLIGLMASTIVMAGPIRYSCSDSDGGNYKNIFGTVSGYHNKVWYSNSDYCVDSSNIMEYYCNGLYKTSQQQSCGTDGYVGNNYCSSDDVYKNFVDYSCANGACTSTTIPTMQQDCGTDGYGENYCANDDVYKDFNDYFCAEGACGSTATPIMQQDCGTDYYSDAYCYNNDLYQQVVDRYCASAACGYTMSQQLVEDCANYCTYTNQTNATAYCI
jgi:hypothetical protein